MRKAQIQAAVREHLAMIGYGAGDYGWPKRGRLSVLVNAGAKLSGGAGPGDPMPGAFIELHLPAHGMSRKRLTEELEKLPTRGPARTIARAPDAPAIQEAML